jgi:hypothetical protein
VFVCKHTYPPPTLPAIKMCKYCVPFSKTAAGSSMEQELLALFTHTLIVHLQAAHIQTSTYVTHAHTHPYSLTPTYAFNTHAHAHTHKHTHSPQQQQATLLETGRTSGAPPCPSSPSAACVCSTLLACLHPLPTATGARLWGQGPPPPATPTTVPASAGGGRAGLFLMRVFVCFHCVSCVYLLMCAFAPF